jgi:hypothetical protein
MHTPYQQNGLFQSSRTVLDLRPQGKPGEQTREKNEIAAAMVYKKKKIKIIS